MNVPFVFLSSSRDVENKILALSMGAAAVFAKPLFINDLIKNIRRILGEYEQKGASESEERAPEGDVSDISVLNILSIIFENGSSGEVEFSASSEKRGVIFCDRGNVIRVETSDGGNSDGMEELYKILSWSDGTFSVNYEDVDVERNISLTQEDLIGKATDWLGKYTEILKDLPPVDTVVYLDFAKFVENLNKMPDDIDPVIRNIGETGSRISAVIDSCGGDYLRTAACLKQLFETGVISVENVDPDYRISVPEWLSKCGNEEKTSENIEENHENAGTVETAENFETEKSEENNAEAESAGTEAGDPEAVPEKSREWLLLLLLLALLAAVVMFVYYRGLI